MYFINGKIHTMEGSNYESGYLHIVNGKIAEIGEMSDFTLDDEKIVDLKDQDVYPAYRRPHPIWECLRMPSPSREMTATRKPNR